MGPVFPVRAQDDTGADPAAIARAYTIAREVFAVRDIWAQIEGLDNRIPAAVQYTAMFQTTRLLRHASYWLHRESAREPGHRARREPLRRAGAGALARARFDALRHRRARVSARSARS